MSIENTTLTKREQSRDEAIKREKNKKRIKYGIWSIIILGIIVSSIHAYVAASEPGEYDELAACITQAGAVMYGTDWCPHCQEQKALFGKSFKNVAYVNCDANQQLCVEKEIEGYPTWIIQSAEGEPVRLAGATPLAQLANQTGCSLS